MRKLTVIAAILAVGLLATLSAGCSGAASSTPPASAPANNTFIPAPSPANPILTSPGPTQMPAQPVQPGIASPSQGTASSGASSSGIMAPAIASIAPSAFPSQPAFLQASSGQSQSTGIWVTGQGQVTAVPDIASLNLGVNSQAATVADAQSAAATAMTAVMQVLKGKGVADKDITTVGFNIYPTYDYKVNRITGYQVTNTIIAKIRNIPDAGPIIDGVTAAGGNLIRINSISFSVDDPTPYLKQARALAVADASAKAGQLATLSGVKLGLPSFITESSGNYVPSPIYFSAAAGAAAPAPTTPISPGETQISVNVQIVYGIQ